MTPGPGPLRLVAALLGLALAAPATGADPAPRVRAELQPRVAAVDEPVLLILEATVEGLGGVELRPEFRLENLVELSGPSSTRLHSWVNGKATSGTRLVWRLRPEAPGTAAVRGIRLEVGEASLELPDREIRVVPAGTRPRPPARRRGLDPFDALMRDDPIAPFRREAPAAAPKLRLASVPSSQRVWVGEQLVWSLVLDTQADVSAFQPHELPDFEGFWVRELPVPERLSPRSVEVDGETFWRVTPLRRALFPLRPGRFRWGPARAEVVARIAEAGWLAPLARSEALTLATAETEVEVLPLPDPPPGFSGAVGELRVEAALDRERLEVGQTATLTVTVSGTGHLARLAPPELAAPAGLRLFEPSAESAEAADGDRLRTTLTWKWVALAEQTGSYRIPLPELSWFDPESASYRVASAEAPRLVATASGPIEAAAGPVPEPSPETGAAPAFRPEVAAAVALALVAGAGLAWTLLRRRRRPARQAGRRLAAELVAARSEHEPAAAAAALEAAWRGWLADRWGIAPSLPVAHWAERLPAAGLPPDRARQLVELFRELHDLRYAPELSDVASLLAEAHELSDRLRRALA